MRKLILSVVFVTLAYGAARADEAPNIADIPYYQDAEAGELFTYDVDATGDPVPTFILTEAPSGMIIDSLTGVIEWTPTQSQGGHAWVRLEAVNSAGSDTGYFSIRVASDKFRPPVLDPIPDQTVNAEEWWRYDADATGYPEPKYYVRSDPDAWIQIDLLTGAMEWHPDWHDAGTYTITVTADSSMGEDHETFELEVLPLMHTVTISSTDGGSVVTPGEGEFEIASGETMSLEAVPDEGYRFVWWTGGNIKDIESPSTTMYVNKNYTLQAVFEPIDGVRHTLTVSAGPGGGVATPGEGTFDYSHGLTVAVRAYSESYYGFLKWTGTAVDAGKVADTTNHKTTVTMDADYTLRANFIHMFLLRAEATPGGTVYGVGAAGRYYKPGAVVSVEARADSGYHFTHWSDTAVEYGFVADPLSAKTTVTVVSDCKLIANFAPGAPVPQPTLTVSSSPGGSVTSPGEGTYAYASGTSVSIAASAETDYEFTGWTGSAVGAGRVTNVNLNPTTVTVDDDYTLMANFSPTTTTTHTLSISAGVGGAITSPGEGTFSCAPDTSVSVVAEVQMGYEFLGWTGTAVDAGKVANPAAVSTSVFVDGDYTLVANFTSTSTTSCALTVSSGEGGAVTAPGEGTFTYAPGAIVSIQAVAADEYNFARWIGTAVEAGKVADPTAASTAVTMAADYTLVAEFVYDTVVLELSSTEGGTVVTPGEGTFSYDYQEYVTLRAESEPGYHFVGWSGSFHASGNPATLQMDANHQVTAVFARNPFTLTTSSGAGGSIITPGEGVIICESDPNVCAVALPEPGYVFAGWSGTIVEAGVLNDSTVARVRLLLEEDASLHANFESAVGCLYVDDDAAGDPAPGNPNVSDPAEDGSWDHPFDAIQEAIDNASDGDAVLVLPGTYRENITFAGKAISVSAFDLAQVGVVSETVIIGTGADSVVVFEAGESASSSLVGFTIWGGEGELGGAIRCDGADPIIAHCLITGNRADLGGGIYCRDSQAVLANCTIADNFGWLEGGGLYCDDNVIVINSILYGNGPDQIAAAPDRAPSVTYSVVQSIVQDSWPGAGNLHCDPRFAGPGHWAPYENYTTKLGPDDPEGIWITGDYHLKARGGRWTGWMWINDGISSRGVDAGNPHVSPGRELPPNGQRINMGAFGGTAEASRSP